VASSCATHISFKQGSNTFTASCTGNASPATLINCTVNLSAAATGNTQLVLTQGSYTLNLPASPLIGGMIIVP